MTKLALQIAIAYLGTEGQLDGTVYDICKMHDVLTGHLGYGAADITVLAEQAALSPASNGTLTANGSPTRNRIMAEIIRLAEIANADSSITEVFFQYSGHGTYIRDQGHTKDEIDGFDECLVPLDYDQPGGDFIPDDEINSVLSLFPRRVTFIGVVDACHSGTMFDLPFRYVSGVKHVEESVSSRIKCKCIMFSGCKDDQVSMDAHGISEAKHYMGAMSAALLASWKVYGYTIGVWQCLAQMRRFLQKREFKQIPQVTTNIRLNRGTLLLNCGDVQPFIQTDVAVHEILQVESGSL